MKFSILTTSVLAFASVASAGTSLTYTPNNDGKIRVGDDIRVKWTTDETYDLTLKLTRKDRIAGWTPTHTAFAHRLQQAGDGEYVFRIPKVKEDEIYAFSLLAVRPDGSWNGDGNRTESFVVEKKVKKAKMHIRDLDV